MIDTSGIDYFTKCSTMGYAPTLDIRNSFFHLDDRPFSWGWPSRIFDTVRVTMSNSHILGYSISPISGTSTKFTIDRSIIDLTSTDNDRIIAVQLKYSSGGLTDSLTNSVINGEISINRGFDQRTYTNQPTLYGNAISQGSTGFLLSAVGSNTPDNTIVLDSNFYIFAGLEDDVIYDGTQNLGKPFLDVTKKLIDRPIVGPNQSSQQILDLLKSHVEHLF